MVKSHLLWRRMPTRPRRRLFTSEFLLARRGRPRTTILTIAPPASLSRHLASRLAPEQITVNTLALGPFPSKMMAATLKDHKESIVAGIPLGRVGEPGDVFGACLWLSGKAGQWITGATVPIEGGHLISAKL